MSLKESAKAPGAPPVRSGPWARFCVVGLGGHARTKLMPAIEANGQTVDAVVTSQAAEQHPSRRVFRSIEEAVAALDRDCAFVIASPPAAHHAQTLAAVQAGFDVIVEKPAFVTEAEVRSVRQAAEANGAILVEAFMHRHAGAHAELLRSWRDQSRLEVRFLIPAMPPGTFRLDAALANASLYDIGSYPVSLMADLGLSLDALAIERVEHAGDPARERVRLTSPDADVEIGVAETYANAVSISDPEGGRIDWSPFFFGRPGPRSVTRTDPSGAVQTETHDEANAFQTMFRTPRGRWAETAAARWDAIAAQTRTLERLAKELAWIRNRSDN